MFSRLLPGQNRAPCVIVARPWAILHRAGANLEVAEPSPPDILPSSEDRVALRLLETLRTFGRGLTIGA